MSVFLTGIPFSFFYDEASFMPFSYIYTVGHVDAGPET